MARVLVTRPEPGASRTINTLIAKGMNATAISLSEIKPIPFVMPADVEAGSFDAIIITSQNALSHGAALLAQFQNLPVFAVGERTSDQLRNRGYTQVIWAPNAQELIDPLIDLSPGHVLYICGQQRRPELELALKAHIIRVTAAEVYCAQAIKSAAAALKSYFIVGGDTFVLLYAPSAAEAFSHTMKQQFLSETVQFICMSPAVAEHLPAYWQSRSYIAATPDEAAMLCQLSDALDKKLAHKHLPKP